MAQITLNSSGVASNGTLALQSNGTTTAVTIDASQNVGVGTTSPAAKLDVQGTAVAAYVGQILTNNSTTGYTQHGFKIGPSGANGEAGIFYAPSIFYKFGVTANDTSTPITFVNNNDTERARIASGGEFLVGTTSLSSITNEASAKAQVAGNFIVGNAVANTNVTAIINGVVSKAGRIGFAESGAIKWLVGNGAASENGVFQIYDSVNGTGVQLSRGATSWSGISDERLKDIIEPITNATNKVSELRAVIGKYKTDAVGTRRSFLIAQDLQKVLPESVDDIDPEKLAVRYTDVIPLLVAAIKEQQVIIESLTTRITALEGQ